MTSREEFKELTQDLPKKPKSIDSPIGDLYQLNGNEHFDRPEMLVEGILTKESITILAGEPKSGKGWLALDVSKQVLARGIKVIYLDRENGKRRMSHRIEALQEGDEEWRSENFYYCFQPAMDQTEEAQKDFEKFLDDFEPDLVIFDSFAGFLSAAGKDENASRDVTDWCEAYLNPLRKRNITALIIDHTPRGESRSRGSMRKSEEADVNLFLDPEGRFDRNTTTTVHIKCLSDRDAMVPEISAYRIGGDGNGGFVFEKAETHRLGLSGQKLRMLEVLEKQGAEGMKHGEWLEAARSEGINASTARSAISALKDYEYEGKRVVKREDSKYYPNTFAGLDVSEEREAS